MLNLLDPEEVALHGRVKIDLDTPLERFFKYSGFASLIGVLICLWVGYLGGEDSPPQPEMLKGIPILLGLAATFYFLRRATDNYYVLDFRNRRILYHFRLLSWEKESPVFPWSDILSVAVVKVLHQTEDSSWLEYRVQLVRRTGEVLDFSDWDKELYPIQTRAEQLEKLIGCPLTAGGEGEVAVRKYHQSGGQPYVSWEPPSSLKNGQIIIWTVLISVIIVTSIILLPYFLH